MGWLSGLCVLLQVCSNSRSTSIPLQVQPHLAEFMAQAKQRGVTIDTTGLTIVFVDSLNDEEGNPVNGKYIRWKFPYRQDIIELDTTQYWWTHHYSREKVIFHELGHCLLHREHRFDTFRRGLPRSIMGETKTHTYEVIPLYRKYYMDELFDATTPDPCWTKLSGCPDYRVSE